MADVLKVVILYCIHGSSHVLACMVESEGN